MKPAPSGQSASGAAIPPWKSVMAKKTPLAMRSERVTGGMNLKMGPPRPGSRAPCPAFHAAKQRQCVGGTGSQGGVVEDAPRRSARLPQRSQLPRQYVEELVAVGRVVDARRTMQPEIRKALPAAGPVTALDPRRIGGDARDLESP